MSELASFVWGLARWAGRNAPISDGEVRVRLVRVSVWDGHFSYVVGAIYQIRSIYRSIDSLELESRLRS